MHRGHLALTRGVVRYSNVARCVGTRCYEGPEAIAACSTRGRGSRERNKIKIDLSSSTEVRRWCCGWHVILHLPAEWQNKIKMEDVFSYIVFAPSGSSIAARGHLWCWLATVARRLLPYGCAQRLRETKTECVHLRHLTLCKKKKSTCSFVPEYVSRVYTVLFTINPVKLGLGTVMLFGGGG